MDCCTVPAVSPDAFLQRLRLAPGSGRLPLSGSIELTRRCNLRCPHCYINLPAGDAGARAAELDAHGWARITDQAADAGSLTLLLTGGEPLLHPGFPSIYRHARRAGILVTVFTNGTLVTPQIADHLAEHPPLAVEITLYGATTATYEAVTGVPGSHRRCMDGIELFLGRGIPLKLKTLLTTLNAHELEGMKAFASSLGVPFRYDPELNLRLDGTGDLAPLRIPPEQVVAGDLADGRRMREWGRTRELRRGAVESHPERLYSCGAGNESFHVDPEGKLSLCMMARDPSFPLPERGFREGWEEFLPRVLERTWRGASPCRGCSLRGVCSWCPGWSQLEHGEDESEVAYLCRITHLRDEAWNRWKEGAP